jgi:hypothetical protein
MTDSSCSCRPSPTQTAVLTLQMLQIQLTNRGVLLLLVSLAHEPTPNSNAINSLNTVNSVVFLLALHFLRLRTCALLATLLRTLATLSSFGFLRSCFAFLAGSRLVDTTRRSASTRGRRRDLRALERVPASAEGAAVLVA